MIRLRSIRKVKEVPDYWVADFETLTKQSNFFQTHQQGALIAWAAQRVGEFDKEVHGCDIKSFEDWLLSLESYNVIFFHNLGKFDGYVIIWHALKHWSNNIKKNKDSKITYSFKKVHNALLTITVKTPKGLIVFQDSWQLIRQSVASLGKIYGYPKLETDYNIDPVEKYEDLPLEMREYLTRDVVIVNRALTDFYVNIKKLSKVWGIELNPFKTTASSLSRDIIEGFDHKKSFKISVASQEESDDYYRGGYTHFNHNYLLKEVRGEDIIMYDAKSHYPSIMYKYYLPDKVPEEFNDMKKFRDMFERKKVPKWKVIFVKVTGRIKQSIEPFGTIAKPYDVNNYHYYPEQVDEEFVFFGLLCEWKMQLRYYKFWEWEFEKVYYWKQGQQILKPVIKDLYWYKENEKNNLAYKLSLNSMYGSCGMKHTYETEFYVPKDTQPEYRTIDRKKTYLYSSAKMENFYSDEYDLYAYEEVKDSEERCWNKWIAAAITSYGRYILQKYISRNAKRVLYCDTDSILMFKDANIFKDSEIGKDLTKWDIDKEGIKSFIIGGAKRYFLFDKDDALVKKSFAGVSENFLQDKEYNELVGIFDMEILFGAQKRLTKKKEYGYFPFIEDVDYKDWKTILRRKELKNEEEK